MENTDITQIPNINAKSSHTFYINNPSDGIRARCLANNFIAQAICSQPVATDLEKRTYLITVQISDITLGRAIGCKIFGSTKKAISQSPLNHLSNISMVTCSDLDGTRNGDPILFKNSHPHIHALLIFPQVLSAMEDLEMRRIIESSIGSIDDALKSARDAKYLRGRDPIHIAKINGENPYWYICDYVTKCEKLCLEQFDVQVDVYPFRYEEKQLLNKEKKKAKLDQLHASVRATYEQLTLFPELYLSEPINLQFSEKHIELKKQIEATSIPISRKIRTSSAVKTLETEPVILT